ncbi:MAG: SMC-Scp complex subunit ScpB [Syntrophomonadaceae bacterium]|nr:SMC-Scp complex subunit ScpB [Syntrophomonadaceae bacterium]
MVLAFFQEEGRAALEAILFVASEPLSLETLSNLIGLNEEDTQELLDELQTVYNGERRGLQIVKVAQGYQMCTRPEYHQYVERLLQPSNGRLSKAALECLAIIAYRQPVTRAEIEQIRGVKADRVISTLLERQLIQEVGRKETIGRPILYGTTNEFLRVFGLNSLSELPHLNDFPSLKPGSFDD